MYAYTALACRLAVIFATVAQKPAFDRVRLDLLRLLNSAPSHLRGDRWTRVARHADMRVRCAALTLLEYVDIQHEDRQKLLAAMAQDEQVEVRCAALRLMRSSGSQVSRAAGLAAANDSSAQVRALAPAFLTYLLDEDLVRSVLRRLGRDVDDGVRLALLRGLAEVNTTSCGQAVRFIDRYIHCHSTNSSLQLDFDEARGTALANAAHRGSDDDLTRLARWIPKLSSIRLGDVQYLAQAPRGGFLLAQLCEAPSVKVRAIALRVARGKDLPGPVTPTDWATD